MSAPRGRRALFLAMAVVAVTLLGAGVVGWALAPTLAERIALVELERRGIPSPRLQISRLGLAGAEITNLQLGDEAEIKVERIAIGYSLRGLARRRIERIEVIRPTIRLTADSGGISLGSLDALLRRGSTESDDTTEDAGSGPATPPTLPPLPEIALREARIEVATPIGPVVVLIDGEIDPTPERTSGRFSIGADTPQIRFSGTLDIEASPHATTLSFDLVDDSGGTMQVRAAIPDTGRTEGTIEARAERLRIPGLATALSGGGKLAATWGEGHASLTAANGARVEIDLDPEILAGIPAHYLPLIGIGVQISVEPGLILARDAEGKVQIKGRGTIAGMGSQAGIAAFDADMVGSPQSPSGRVLSTLTFPQLDIGNVRVTAPKLTLPLSVAAGAGGQIELHLTEPGSLGIEKIVLKGKAETSKPITLPLLARQDLPLLQIERGENGAISPSAALHIGKSSLTVALTQAARVEGGWEGIDLGFRSDGGDGSAREMVLSGGFVRAPDFAWSAEGIAAHLASPSSFTGIVFTADRVAHRRKPPMVVPLRLSGTVILEETAIRFTVRGEDATKRLIAEARGQHALQQASGTADFAVRPIEMARGGLQLKNLFPGLDPGVENVDGTVAVAGSASWKSGTVRSNANLLVRDLSFEKSGVRVERLNGVVAVDNLIPLSTKPDQRLAVAAVQAGVPLTDGLFTFEVRDGGVLDIRDGRLKLADGQVSVTDVTLTAGPQRQTIPLQVTGVDLGLLLDLAGLDGLTGSGRLSGTIPVILAGNDVEITGGALTAREPGRIGYDPTSPPAALQGGGEQVALALLALKDFHYDRLQVTLDRKLGGETVIGMHIAGRNPDFYDGYPVEFNLNLTGKLDQILRHGLASYRLPDEIRKRLESFPPDPLKSP